MDLQEARALLAGRSIAFTGHAARKLALRGLSEQDILSALQNPGTLVAAQDQGDHPLGHKYGLLFERSHKYDLRIIVSLSEGRLNVMTTHIQNRKRRKVYHTWLEKRT